MRLVVDRAGIAGIRDGRRPVKRFRRHVWRLAFLFLVVIPFIPMIVALGAAVVAELEGCQPDQKDLCVIGPLPVSEIIAWALRSGATMIVENTRKSDTWLYVAIAAWLSISYVILIFGWTRLLSRLSLGFVLALAFALLPYFGLMLAISGLTHKDCRPNDAYVGPCTLFGGEVGRPAHDAVNIGWLAFDGVRLAFGIFAVYVVVVIVLALVSARRPAASA